MRIADIHRGALTASALLLAACSTPKHTNTLIFGTSTRVALDVSQDPTGPMSVTLGYKRYEAVWMPLLANVAGIDQTNLVPSNCNDDKCRSFVGTTGTDGGAAGAGSRDTYSVLATFGGDTTGSVEASRGVGGKAVLKQVFATGIAARLLAQSGGAALVNTNASTGAEAHAVPPDVAKANQTKVDAEEIRIRKVLAAVTDGGALDKDRLKAVMDKAALGPDDTVIISSFPFDTAGAGKLERHLRRNADEVLARMFSALP